MVAYSGSRSFLLQESILQKGAEIVNENPKKKHFSYVIGGIGLILLGLFLGGPLPFFWGLLSFLGFFVGGVFLILRGIGKL